ncbi:MAG TPA: PLP-dependent aminotransferase family protein [Candidatus Dormibacteraeota bacterium]|nr:PLP-dependent aminotransferase family protein [Candidatus Dormibacteraeota bacterium]
MKRVASGLLPIIAVDRRASQPLHRQIYDSFRAAILDGRLRPGQRIPSSRVFASEIGVSRFPVLNAYAQLVAEGYLQSHVGAGTVVSGSLPEYLTSSGPMRAKSTPVRAGLRLISHRCSLVPPIKDVPWMVPFGPFRVGQVAFDQFPLHTWSALVARRSRNVNAESAHYGDLVGQESLRRAIANYLRTARAVRCEPEQVLIVNGSQQALEIATRVLLNPGDRVWIENPSYRLARDVFALNECRMEPIPVDAEGLDVPAGIRRCRKARAAFVTPSHQFPLGVTMSASRRLQLVDWARNSGAWIIEDDYDSEYRYESLPIPSLQGLDNNSRVIYIGTFSKVLFPSLRLGYIVVPPDLIESFVTMRRVMDLGLPTFHQQALADFIDEGHFARHIRRMRIHYGELRRVLFENLSHILGNMVEVIGDEAGMHLTVILQNKLNDEEISRRAARQNLSLWPLSPFYLGQTRQGFILGFGGTTVREIPHAVRKLRTLLIESGTALV